MEEKELRQPDPVDFQVSKPSPSPTGTGKIDWTKRRIAPHWSLLVAALVLWAFLIDLVRPYLNPLTISIAILLLLYPSHRTRAIKPLLFLTFVTTFISLWWRLHALLLPFIIAFILAYAFDPAIDWAVRRRIPRIVAVLILVLGFMGGVVTLAILLLPRLIEEVGTLAAALPEWMDLAKRWVTVDLLPWAQKVDLPVERIWGEIQPRLPTMFKSVMGGLADWIGKALSGIVGIMTGLANLILIPILTIYFLNDFGKLRSWIYQRFPAGLKDDALSAYYRLNDAMSAFIRGQMIVCLFLAIWIGGGLAIFVRLPYALIIGAAAGLLNLIPYVGTTIALIVTVGVALFQDDPIVTALKAVAVFVSGQALEGNVLTPRIVGDKVGLHPLIVIFTVLSFASLFGLVGMLVAIPVAAGGKALWLVYRGRQKRIAAKFLKAASELDL